MPGFHRGLADDREDRRPNAAVSKCPPPRRHQRTPRRAAQRLLGLGVGMVALASVFFTAAASAAGPLTQLPGTAGCLKARAYSWIPCTTTVKGMLDARDVGLSPDGRFAYVPSELSSTVVLLSRDPTSGALQQLADPNGCVKDVNGPGSTAYRADTTWSACPGTAKAIRGAHSVAISPDPQGQNVYVVGLNGDSIAAFARNSSTGALTQLPGSGACVKGDTAPSVISCSVIARGLHGVRSIIVSQDGKNVYTVSSAADAISAFSRDPTTGALTPLPGSSACIEDRLAPPETTCAVTGIGLNYPRTLAISPDRRHVYVASDVADRAWPGDPADGDAVSAFARNPVSGALSQLPGNDACIEGLHAPSSTLCPQKARGLDEVYGVSVSPDGNSVYVASPGGDYVAIFARSPISGGLTQLGGNAACIANSVGNAECPVRALGLDGAQAVTISPDGASAYVAAFTGGSIAALARDSVTGALTQFGGAAACIEGFSAPSSTTCPTVAKDMQGPRVVTLSPDGKNAYVVASSSGTLTAYSR
jgi:6-phosphogluconolactonase (cycloisomerase 2 family)